MKGARPILYLVLLLAVPLLLLATPPVASDQALLILRSDDYADTQRTMEELEAIGCHAQHVMPNRAIIADVPKDAEFTVRALPNVTMLFRNKVPSNLMAAGEDIKHGFGAWNAILEPNPPIPAGAHFPIGDERVVTQAADDNIRSMYADSTAAKGEMGILAAASRAPGYYDTSDYMCGKVAIGIVLPESTGSAENWSTSRQDTVYNQIVKGMNQWATIGGTAAHLTFIYEKKFSISTSYEPIQTSDSTLWIKDCMAKMGFSSGTDIDRTRAYDNNLRSRMASDWAYTVFVADSYNDADGCFPGGGFAWAELFGPYMVMTYDNTTWGISNMFRNMAHESAHIFCAGDEYTSSWWNCSPSYYYGYLWVADTNCELNNPSSVPCIMRHEEVDANGVVIICRYTKYHVGMRDSDGDGVYDPLDCGNNNSLNSVTSPTQQQTITFTGTVNITPYPCGHPKESWGGPNSCTINKIARVEYKVDGGTVYQASATDGSFNSDSEDYNFTATLSAGTHTVQTWSFDQWNRVQGSNIISVTVQSSDTQPPTAPTNLAADGTDYNKCHLTWTASTDNVGVTGYEVQRNGAAIATVGNVTGYDDTTCSANTAYTYQIRARDAVGNWSGLSNSAGAHTWAIVLQDNFANLNNWTASAVADGTTRGVSLETGQGGNSGAPCARADLGSTASNGSYSYKGFSYPFNYCYIECLFNDTSTTSNSRNGIAFRKFNGTAARLVYFLGNDQPNSTTAYSCDVYGAAGGWVKHATGGNRATGWRKFRVLVDGTNALFYVDGGLKDTMALPAEAGEGVDRFYIGNNYNVNTVGYYDDFFSAAPVPLTPAAGSPSAIGTDTITWNFNAGGRGYEFGFYAEDTGGNVKVTAGRTATSMVETALPANTLITRNIIAYNGSIESDAAQKSATTLSIAPTVSNITCSPAAGGTTTDGTFTFTSQAPFGPGGVQYYRYVMDTSPAHTWSGSESQWTSNNLVIEQTVSGIYYLHLKGYNSANVENDTVDIGPFTYDSQSAPLAPTGVAASATGSSTIHVTWNATSHPSGITNYEVWCNGSALATVSGTTLSYDDTGLSSGTTYSYQVRAKNGEGRWSDLSTAASAMTRADIVIDNTGAFSASSNWQTGTMSTDKYGTDYRWRQTEAISDAATWTFNLPAAGSYDVYAWWTVGTNRSTTAPYMVGYSGGTATVNVNQQVNGGKWNLLGRWNFNAGTNTIRLSCWTTTGYVVIADAVRMVGPF